eukprot:SAG22_NODE_875_length_6716_cov_2.927006_2_plen_121_part_00
MYCRNEKIDKVTAKKKKASGRRVNMLETGGASNAAIDLSAAVAISLKFARKVRGIKAEVKAPPPKPGMENTAWARNTGTKAQAANHAAAEKAGKTEVREKVAVEDVDSAHAIGGKLLGGT